MKILIFNQNLESAQTDCQTLNEAGHQSKCVSSKSECFDELASNQYDLILADCDMQRLPILQFIDELKQKEISLPVVVFTKPGDEKKASEAIARGAYDYIIHDRHGHYLILLPTVAEGARQKYQVTQENIEYREELTQLTKQLAQIAIEDRVTGLYNRRKMEVDLEVEFDRARRYDYPLTCLMLDIDNFRQITDTYGYRVGDSILRGLGQILQGTRRKTDSCYRYGGEKLLILMPHTPFAGVEIFAGRLQRLIRDCVFEIDDQSFQITVSMGIATYQRGKVDTPDKLLKSADNALHDAKSSGSNRMSA